MSIPRRIVVPGRSKYFNEPVVYDGRRFASKAEGSRYLALKTVETLGQIHELRCQVRFPFVINRVKIGAYVADFVYLEAFTGRLIVEDVKGYRTREYKLKAKLMLAIHGIKILETT